MRRCAEAGRPGSMECLQSVPYRGARLFPVWQAGVAGARTGGVLCGRRVLLQGRKGVSGECVLNVEGARRPVTGSQRLNKRVVRTRLRIKSSASAVSTLSLQRPVREDACRKRTKCVPTGTSHTRVWCCGCSNERELFVEEETRAPVAKATLPRNWGAPFPFASEDVAWLSLGTDARFPS